MKLSELITELKAHENYASFMKENPDAFLTAGFFILHPASPDADQYQLDFFLPQMKKLAIAKRPFWNIKIEKDAAENATRLDEEIAVDVGDLPAAVAGLLEKNGYRGKVDQIISVLQNGEWNLTIMSPALDMHRIKIDAKTGECKKFEKLSMFDFMKVVKTK